MVGEIGQVGLFWGSHLGSLRSQAMISWDYDADIAVLLQYSGSAKLGKCICELAQDWLCVPFAYQRWEGSEAEKSIAGPQKLE